MISLDLSKSSEVRKAGDPSNTKLDKTLKIMASKSRMIFEYLFVETQWLQESQNIVKSSPEKNCTRRRKYYLAFWPCTTPYYEFTTMYCF